MSMALIDGFDYLIASNLVLKWDLAPGWTVVTGVFGKGKAVFTQTTTDLVSTLNTNTVSGRIAVHATIPAFATTTRFQVFKDGGTTQVDVRMDNTGLFFFSRNGTQIGVKAATNFRVSVGQVYWLEAEVIIHSTLGVANLYINSDLVLSQSGLNTQATANQYFNQVGLGGGNGVGGTTYDDFHYWDFTAGDVNVFPYTEHIIDTQLANVVGTNTTWNKGGTVINANNYQQVNEANEDGDTTYVFMSASGAGDIDSYGFGNLTEISGTIGTIAINTIARIDDAGPHVYKNYSLSGGSNAVSANITPGASYVNAQTFQGTDPNTGVAWTISGRNAAQFGYKFIS